jgi:hypothetical protein
MHSSRASDAQSQNGMAGKNGSIKKEEGGGTISVTTRCRDLQMLNISQMVNNLLP